MIKIDPVGKGIPSEDMPYIIAQLLIIAGILLAIDIILTLILLWKCRESKEN